ncbi:MAG: glycosyltransferase family 4 protein, partial [Muribaculaceae bacterium]|nr:glycosyltransferase family 4 protein [Muribaculaceae bacterium]
YGGEVVYWIIGDGPQYEELKSALGKTALNAVLWGRKKAEEIPAMLNCVDVLVLPSRMEGLPLVAAEAIACGANVVGSRVGGIPEVIGEENTFSHGDDFNVQIAARAVEMLEGKVAQHVPESMSWERTSMKELAIYREAKK